MFASLSDNPEFYRDKMKMFVALAPVVSIKHMNSVFLKDIMDNESSQQYLTLMGPEMFYKATADNFVSGLFAGSALGNATSGQITAKLSDSKPELINQVAQLNYFKFYPAGCSVRSLDHFMQLYHTGEFKKYDHGSAEKN
mmetsp:Transcript_14424/g.22375  ORF Transcript_14424/g.22375 Transcript_14424/m.22375 type:complete len:140 (+) Transcript_14424:683-1102(+)